MRKLSPYETRVLSACRRTEPTVFSATPTLAKLARRQLVTFREWQGYAVFSITAKGEAYLAEFTGKGKAKP